MREAFEGSTVLITGATGWCNLPVDFQRPAPSITGDLAYLRLFANRCVTDAGYIGGLVLEQLLRVGCIGKVSQTIKLTTTPSSLKLHFTYGHSACISVPS